MVGFAAGDIPKVPANLLLLRNAQLVSLECRLSPVCHVHFASSCLDWLLSRISFYNKSSPLGSVACLSIIGGLSLWRVGSISSD